MLGIITRRPARRHPALFALLVIYFFLAGWTGMRKRTIVTAAASKAR